MRRIAVLLLSLIACSGWAADGGTGADAGPDWKAKPIFLLADAESVIDKYALAKPADRSKVKGVLTKVVVGTRVAAGILLEGYELPYSRRVDVSADIVITDPEGKEMVDKASIAGAQTMDPKVMLLLPLKPVFGLIFGLTDREGEYKVRIMVRDNIRGEITRLETKFLVTR